MNKVEQQDDELLLKQRHSLAHILAQAIQRTIDPMAKLWIWPAIDVWFYYDFIFSDGVEFKEEQLKELTKKMQWIIKENQPFHRIDVDYKKAKEIVKMMGEEFKIELMDEFKAQGETNFSFYINTIPVEAKERLLKDVKSSYIEKYTKLTTYLQKLWTIHSTLWTSFVTFIDMCEWPHVETGKEINVDTFQLDKIAWAYWRGSEKNPMMTRIYWLAFESKEKLKEYNLMMEEAKKRDHKILGQKFDLFSFSEYGPWFPFFHHNGMMIINELQKYWREVHYRDGYQEIKTPIMLSKELRELSGHRWHYNNNMYISVVDEQEYAIKPMNCPGGMLVYKTSPKSYRDLPLKSGEFGLVHRHELSGTLNGLFRVRTFTQDDAHIFCTPDQFKDEIKKVMDLIFEVYAKFWFTKLAIELSTRPEENYVWDIADWDLSEQKLKEVLEEKGVEYALNEWDGAFYGPKIDFKVFDAIGREWQCGTIQLDFNLPKRFNLEYIGEDWQKHTPIMLHRVVYGSMERFLGILIEHYAWAFPLWLAPEQVRIIPVAEPFVAYAESVSLKLKAQGLRSSVDNGDDSFSKKIRNAELMKIPYIVIVGEKEQAGNSLSIREYVSKKQYEISVEEFVSKALEEYKTRASN